MFNQYYHNYNENGQHRQVETIDPDNPPKLLYDPGEKDAKDCLLMGLLSLFFLHFVFGVLGLIRYKVYQETGNGDNQHTAVIGKLLSIASIVNGILFVFAGLIYYTITFTFVTGSWIFQK